MKINILSPGRFHVLDLARELDRNGHDVKFYSFVPKKRAMSFGLPAHCSCSLIWAIAPFLFLAKIFKKQWAVQLRIWVQDRMTALVMRKCDVLIAMSGDFVVAPRKAKNQGAKIIIERGSKHILEQKRILESIPSLKGKKPVPDANVKRELECYEIADYISIASDHVKRSFLQHGYPEEKLFVNPYGVDLSMFYPTDCDKQYDVIMVGAWSYQKGCDLVEEAIKCLNCTLLHVGALVDVPFPTGNQFTHVDPVNQNQLIKYYNQAKVFLIPSRQEGLAMVQAQAIACNLPVIGSPDSGAEDLRKLVADPKFVLTIEDHTSVSVAVSIKKALELQKTLSGIPYAGDAINNLTWQSYGDRYNNFLKESCS